MSQVVTLAEVAGVVPIVQTCHHVKNLVDEHGNLEPGSYVAEPVHGRFRVICRYCGRFYGYFPGEPPDCVRQPSAGIRRPLGNLLRLSIRVLVRRHADSDLVGIAICRNCKP